MNIFAMLSLSSFIISFIFSNFIYYQNRNNRLNRIFALTCLLISIAAFCEFMYRQTNDYNTAYIWMKISFLWPFIITALAQSALILTERTNLLKSKIFNTLLYFPAVLFSLLDLMLSEPIKKYWGYTRNIHPDIRISIIISLWIIGFGLLGLFLCVKYFFQTDNKKKKKQAKYIGLGFSFPFIILCSTNLIFPLLRIEIPELSNISMCWVVIFISFAIWKYELFIVNPETAAEKIISTISDSLILFSPDFKILIVNKSLLSLLEYNDEELIGQPATKLFGQKQDEILEELLQKGNLQNLEQGFKTQSGEIIPISASYSLIKDKENENAGIVCVARDIREMKDLQAKLISAEKMSAIGQLAGGVAHEINNPMGVILGFAQSISRRIKEDDPLYLPLKSIEREAVRCRKLVVDLLTFSRAEKTKAEETDINQTIEETLSFIEARSKVKGIDIIKEYGNRIPRIMVNKNQIQQVIVNLCNNAMDAMSDGGKIKIATKETGGWILIEVSDTGKGMTKEVKKHLFEPFFTTKEVGKGTGLGLSLCYEIINSNKGTIEVESEPDKGTVFIIKLPVLKG